MLTERVAVSLVIVLVGLLVLAWQAHTLGLRRRRSELEARPGRSAARRLALAAGDGGHDRLSRWPSSRPASRRRPWSRRPSATSARTSGRVLLGLPLAVAGWLVLGARDPRRFVIGTLGAMAIWFVVFQPDIAALPVPTGIARLFQTLPLPTYNYDFQFAVNTADATTTNVVSIESIALTAMVAFLAGAAMYAASAWRAGRVRGHPRAIGTRAGAGPALTRHDVRGRLRGPRSTGGRCLAAPRCPYHRVGRAWDRSAMADVVSPPETGGPSRRSRFAVLATDP